MRQFSPAMLSAVIIRTHGNWLIPEFKTQCDSPNNSTNNRWIAWFAAQATWHFTFEENLSKRNEVKWTWKADIWDAEFMAVGKATKAIFLPSPGLEEATFDSSAFSLDGNKYQLTLLNVALLPKVGVFRVTCSWWQQAGILSMYANSSSLDEHDGTYNTWGRTELPTYQAVWCC